MIVSRVSCCAWRLRLSSLCPLISALRDTTSTFKALPPVAPAPGGGPAPPPAPPLPAPATPHSFTRCRIGGTDDTLDYVRVPAACKIVKALPDLGWVDASSASPGHMAAPILKIAFGACTAATADWATPPAAIKALLMLSELLVAPSLPFLTRCADALDGLGVYDKVYKQTDKFLDAVELAVGRAPNPSPFELQAGDLVETTTFLNGGSPGVPAVFSAAALIIMTICSPNNQHQAVP